METNYACEYCDVDGYGNHAPNCPTDLRRLIAELTESNVSLRVRYDAAEADWLEMRDNRDRCMGQANKALRERDQARERLKVAQEALNMVEWIVDDRSGGFCPWCNGRFYEDETHHINEYYRRNRKKKRVTFRHANDCKRQEALRQLGSEA